MKKILSRTGLTIVILATTGMASSASAVPQSNPGTIYGTMNIDHRPTPGPAGSVMAKSVRMDYSITYQGVVLQQASMRMGNWPLTIAAMMAWQTAQTAACNTAATMAGLPVATGIPFQQVNSRTMSVGYSTLTLGGPFPTRFVNNFTCP